MPHTYIIKGMTCNECVANVKKRLLDTGFLLAAEVQLSEPQATIIMYCRITVPMLQTAIGSKYIIEESDYAHALKDPKVPAANQDNYYPVFLQYAYIGDSSFLRSWKEDWVNSEKQ